jgi:hypothetical protein
MGQWGIVVGFPVQGPTQPPTQDILVAIQINDQPDATISTVYRSDVYLQLNTFLAFSLPSSGADQLQ